MSPTDLTVTAVKEDVHITIAPPRAITLKVPPTPGLVVIAAGNVGPPGQKGNTGDTGPAGPVGPPGKWLSLSQEEYDLLSPPDVDTLYIIVS